MTQEENKAIKKKAEYLINEFGHGQAVKVAKEVIKVIPMYTGNLNPKWKFWSKVQGSIEASAPIGIVIKPKSSDSKEYPF